jgi:hypothetical protein
MGLVSAIAKTRAMNGAVPRNGREPARQRLISAVWTAQTRPRTVARHYFSRQ